MPRDRGAGRRVLLLLSFVFVLQTVAGLALGARMFSTVSDRVVSNGTGEQKLRSFQDLPLIASAGITHPPRIEASNPTEVADITPGHDPSDADVGEGGIDVKSLTDVDAADVPATSTKSASTSGGQQVALVSAQSQLAGLPGPLVTGDRWAMTTDTLEPIATVVEDPAILATQAESLHFEGISLMLGPPPVELFPVLGGGPFSSSFGAPRDGGRRQHKGNDIFAEKMTPVLAVAPGTVVGAPSSRGVKCCYLKIEHEDGSQAVYLHLNNDTPGTDDGMGWGLADGIAKGAHVEAGDVIGYVGDSGNAEETDSHLHFEYRVGGTEAIDPYQMLNSAPILMSLDEAVTTLETDSVQAPVTDLPYTGYESVWLAVLAAALIVSGSWVLLRGSQEVPVEE